MALVFIDGFDHYECDTTMASFSSQLLQKWTGILANFGSANIAISPAYARQLGGQGLQMATSTNNNLGVGLYKTLNAGGVATIAVGVAVFFQAVPGTNPFLAFMDGTTEQISLRGDGAGHIVVSRSGTTLATSTNTVSTGVWTYIEFMATIHPTAGVIQVNVNGTSTGWVPSTGTLNTRSTANSQVTGIALGCGATTLSAPGIRFDDLYVVDTTGSLNNTILGPQTVTVLRPESPGNYAQWTPNNGANFGNVGDVFPDGDVSFNQSGTAAQKDSFAFQDLYSSAATIAGIQHVLYARQDAGAQRVIKTLQRTGGADFLGANGINLGASYNYFFELHDTDPSTSSAWTLANLNASEFGYDLVS